MAEREFVYSDTGETWQSRAIKAELAAADLRARLDAAERREAQVRADRTERMRAAEQAADQARRGHIEADEKRRRDLRVIAEKLAQVYGRTAEFAAINGPDEGGYGTWCEVHDELWGDHDHDRIELSTLLTFIADTLALDHPSVRFPEPGPATIANACVLARTELARHGGTLDDVAEAILRMAAQPQRLAEEGHAGR